MYIIQPVQTMFLFRCLFSIIPGLRVSAKPGAQPPLSPPSSWKQKPTHRVRHGLQTMISGTVYDVKDIKTSTTYFCRPRSRSVREGAQRVSLPSSAYWPNSPQFLASLRKDSKKRVAAVKSQEQTVIQGHNISCIGNRYQPRSR